MANLLKMSRNIFPFQFSRDQLPRPTIFMIDINCSVIFFSKYSPPQFVEAHGTAQGDVGQSIGCFSATSDGIWQIAQAVSHPHRSALSAFVTKQSSCGATHTHHTHTQMSECTLVTISGLQWTEYSVQPQPC